MDIPYSTFWKIFSLDCMSARKYHLTQISFRKISVPESKSDSRSLGFVSSMPVFSKRFSSYSFRENMASVRQQYWAKISQVPMCRLRYTILLVLGSITLTALVTGIYLLSTVFPKKEPQAIINATTINTPSIPRIRYDCVNGSIAKVLLDTHMYPLIELNVPEQYATLTMDSVEYLLISNVTTWWYAQKYCTAWCGHLVSIKGSTQNEMVLGMHKFK